MTFTPADLAVIRNALADANRYHQLRWSMCKLCSPGRLCARHAPDDEVARGYRELAGRMSTP